MASSLTVNTPKQLYRYLCRKLNILPQDIRDYYKHRVRQVRLDYYPNEIELNSCQYSINFTYGTFRQEFASYSDESDPERVQQIIQQAMKDVEWVLQKVSA